MGVCDGKQRKSAYQRTRVSVRKRTRLHKWFCDWERCCRPAGMKSRDAELAAAAAADGDADDDDADDGDGAKPAAWQRLKGTAIIFIIISRPSHHRRISPVPALAAAFQAPSERCTASQKIFSIRLISGQFWLDVQCLLACILRYTKSSEQTFF